MNADGSNHLLLIEGQPGGVGFPDWSHDGARIVVGRDDADNDEVDIFLMDADGSNEVKLLDDGSYPDFFFTIIFVTV